MAAQIDTIILEGFSSLRLSLEPDTLASIKLNDAKADKWSGVTAPVGSALRSAQLIVDHHISQGKLVYTSDALAEDIANLLDNDLRGFEANWKLALRQRDEARQTAAFAGVKVNDLVSVLKDTTEALKKARQSQSRV